MRRSIIDVESILMITLALCILLLPLRWFVAAITAAAVHEAFHILTIYLLGGRIWKIHFGIRGAMIVHEPLSPGKEMVAAAAGPVGGLILLFLAKWMPKTALCGLIQTLFNLLPIYPLDGGRVIRAGLSLLFGESTSDRLSNMLSLTFAAVICIGATILRLGILIPLILLTPYIRDRMEKFLALRTN